MVARVAFLWFWAAYAGGALTTLFGAAFLPLKQHGRKFGLAFAAALLVHLALVGWRCRIGAVPPVQIFLFFGSVAALTFVLAILSFGDLHTILGPQPWYLLRTVGMNVILYAFFKDFMQDPMHGATRHIIGYLPFAAMTIVAPLLKIAAWAVQQKQGPAGIHHQDLTEQVKRSTQPTFRSRRP